MCKTIKKLHYNLFHFQIDLFLILQHQITSFLIYDEVEKKKKNTRTKIDDSTNLKMKVFDPNLGQNFVLLIFTTKPIEC